MGAPNFDGAALRRVLIGSNLNIFSRGVGISEKVPSRKRAALASFGLVGCHPSLTLQAIDWGLRIRTGTLVHLRLSNCSSLFFPLAVEMSLLPEPEDVVVDEWAKLSTHCAVLESLDLSFSGEPVGKAGEVLRANFRLTLRFAAAVSALVRASPLLKRLWLRGCPALQTQSLVNVLDACGPYVEVLDLSWSPNLASRTVPGSPLLGQHWPPHNSLVKAALLHTLSPSGGAAKWSNVLRCLSIRGASLGETSVGGLSQLLALEELDLAAVDGVGSAVFIVDICLI